MDQRRKRCSKLPLIGALAALALLNVGGKCSDLYNGEANGYDFRYAVLPQKLPAGKITEFFSEIGFTLPATSVSPTFDFASSSNIDWIYIRTIALRTLKASDFGADGKAIEENLLSDEPFQFDGPDPRDATNCSENQITANFIDTLDIWLQRDRFGAKSYRVAHYVKSEDQTSPICGFYLEPDLDPETGEPYNIKKMFFPYYTVTIKGTGTEAPRGIKLGGYISIDFRSDNVQIPKGRKE